MIEDMDMMEYDDMNAISINGLNITGDGTFEDESTESPNTVEVMDFLEGYTSLCKQKNAAIVSVIQKSLLQAIDGGPIPKVFDFRGSKGELREKRANDEYVEIIFKCMKNVTFLKELNLSFNEIGNRGAKEIATFLKTDINLEILYLNSNSIGSDGAIFLAQALHVNESLNYLNISYNPLKDDGGMHIANMLQINGTLNRLDLAGCDFGSRSLIALATVLKCNDRLRSVSLSDNKSHWSNLTQSLQTDTMTHLCRMIRLNSTLTDFKLAKMGVTDWTAVDLLAKALKESNSLKSIDLSSNKISRDGAVAIAKALHGHEKLKMLKLSCCSIFDEGAEAMRDLLANNTVLQILHLDHNSITGKGLLAIADGIKNNKSLRRITLWGNHWDVPACDAYAILLGIVAFETRMSTDDALPAILFASNIRKNPSFRPNSATKGSAVIIRPVDVDKKYEKKAPLYTALLKEQNVDFTLYSVEGVLNVAQKAYDYDEEL